MKLLRTARRAGLLLAAAGTLLGAAGTPAAASAALPATGWIRLAHLAPDTPAMDVYLYSFGNPAARTVLRHVSYGTVSAYRTVLAGDYSVAMRAAGAPAASKPVLSASVQVAAGHAYTAAAEGPRSGLRLEIVGDDLTTPAGKALVRVIQASLKQQVVTVRWDGRVIASRLRFSAATSYQAVPPGTETVAVSAGAAGARSRVSLAPGAVHTLVVLDGAHGLEIANLEDAAGSGRAPAGGAAAGLGGTAPRGPGSPAPWLAVIAAGSLLTAAGSAGRRRAARRARPEA